MLLQKFWFWTVGHLHTSVTKEVWVFVVVALRGALKVETLWMWTIHVHTTTHSPSNKCAGKTTYKLLYVLLADDGLVRLSTWFVLEPDRHPTINLINWKSYIRVNRLIIHQHPPLPLPNAPPVTSKHRCLDPPGCLHPSIHWSVFRNSKFFILIFPNQANNYSSTPPNIHLTLAIRPIASEQLHKKHHHRKVSIRNIHLVHCFNKIK